MRQNKLFRTTLTRISLFSLLCLFLLPNMAMAKQNAIIENIKLANTRDDLLAYFDIKNAFTNKMNEAIKNGIPTTFSLYINLYKTGGSWFDKKISNVQVKSTLKYNSMKKEYLVHRPWKTEQTVVTQSFDEARSLMTDIDNLKIIPLNSLVKGDKYQLRIKAELDKVTLPLSLHNILVFVSFWDFQTNWYVINFTY